MATNLKSDTALVERIAGRIPDAPDGARPGRAQLAGVAATIARSFHPERIILFGSRANGAATSDSDVDLMVIMETSLRPVDQAVCIRLALDLRPSFPLDILVRTPDQIAVGLSEGDFFIRDVIAKGIALYESAHYSLG
jgi:predicted nucleotidyltransferase